MTDVMDDSLSWEQRRELRRKKRQELLAEADRLVQKPEVTSNSTSSRSTHDCDAEDEFEKERQKRRREREERRRKEREEFEQQLKEEEEQKSAERDRRKERRRWREEMERCDVPAETHTSTTEAIKMETFDDINSYQETTETVTESSEVVTEEVPFENGRVSEPSSEDANDDVTNGHVDDAGEVESEQVNTVTITRTTISITNQKKSFKEDKEDADHNEVQEKLNALKIKRQQSIGKRYTNVDDDEISPEERKAKLKAREERQKARERKIMEEEETKKEEAAKREAEYKKKCQIEREERERRWAEAEAKRQEYRKQLNRSEDCEPSSPLSPKVLASPLVSKVEQLNKHLSDSPKTTKTTPVAKVGSLDSRLEKYTKQASKQEVKKASGTPGIAVSQDVSNRRNRWERGEVALSSEKPTSKKEALASVGDVSSRKNLWESGKVTGSFKGPRKTDDVIGADFSSRKNQWLKITQQESFKKSSSESPVGIKTGVLSRLNQWEKGEVGNSPVDKGRMKSDLPSAAGVGDRRAKWENINTDSSKTGSGQKKLVRVATAVSDKKNVFESKKEEQQEGASNASYDRSNDSTKDDYSYSSQGDDDASGSEPYDDE